MAGGNAPKAGVLSKLDLVVKVLGWLVATGIPAVLAILKTFAANDAPMASPEAYADAMAQAANYSQYALGGAVITAIYSNPWLRGLLRQAAEWVGIFGKKKLSPEAAGLREETLFAELLPYLADDDKAQKAVSDVAVARASARVAVKFQPAPKPAEAV